MIKSGYKEYFEVGLTVLSIGLDVALVVLECDGVWESTGCGKYGEEMDMIKEDCKGYVVWESDEDYVSCNSE